jgi:hypothetical protein
VGSQSTAAASLEGVAPKLTYYSGTSASGTALSGAPTTAGTYAVLASFAGSTDYTSASASTSFTINPGVPTLAIGGPSATYNSGGGAVLVAPAATLSTGDGAFANSSLSVANPDGGGNDRLLIQSAGLLSASSGTLSYNSTPVGTYSGGAGTTPLAVSFNASATQAAILAVVQNVTFSNVTLTPGLGNRSINFQLTDGLGNVGAVVTQTVVITTPPMLANTVTTVTYNSGGGPVLVAPTATLSTGDGYFASSSLSVTNTNGGGNDRLSIQSSGLLSAASGTLSYNGTQIGTYSGGTGTTTPLAITFNASATQAAILAVVQNVTFANTILNPALSNRTIDFQLIDGAGYKGGALAQTVAITTPPVLATTTTSVTYTAGGAAVAVASTATLSAGDGDFANSSLSVTNANGASNDRLSIHSSGLLTVSGSTLIYNGTQIGTFSGGSGTTPLVVTFNASATQAAILAVAQNVVFSDILANPTAGNRTINFQLTDGAGNKGAVVTQTVSVT